MEEIDRKEIEKERRSGEGSFCLSCIATISAVVLFDY